MHKPRHVVAVIGLLSVTVAWNSASAQFGFMRRGNPQQLAGTYELDRARSDNATQVVDRATRSLPPQSRDRVYQNFMARLASPDQIALDVRGRTVTMASTQAPQMSFDADGMSRTENGPNGRPMTTRAYFSGNQLNVTTSGNRGSDFTATFDVVPGGMRVTRRLDSDLQNTSVTVQSFYRRVAVTPRWDMYRAAPAPPPPAVALVPNGTQLTVRLDQPLSARTVRDGERFSATVVGRGLYDGAVVDGVVGRVPGGPGRADNMAFDFDHIRLRDGRSDRLDATIESVRLPDGSTIRVDRSGAVDSRNRPPQTQNNVQNGAVGAAIGAIIGAIAGGGKGAVIGAVAGGVVGGSGMLVVEGRSELSLPAGTMLTISTMAPGYAYRRN